MPTITLEKTKTVGLSHVPHDLQELVNRKPPTKAKAKRAKKLKTVNARYDFKKRSWCIVDDNNKVVSYHPIIVLADVTFVTVDVEHCAERKLKQYIGCGVVKTTGQPCRRGHATGQLVGIKKPKTLPDEYSARIIGFNNQPHSGGFYHHRFSYHPRIPAKTAGYLVLENGKKPVGYFMNKRN